MDTEDLYNTQAPVYNKNWGLEIYEFAIKLLDNIDSSDQIDLHGYAAIVEHKKVIEGLVGIIVGNGKEEKYKDKIKYCQDVIDKAKTILGLCIKYNITGNRKILLNFVKHIRELEIMDKNMMIDILEMIGDKKEAEK